MSEIASESEHVPSSTELAPAPRQEKRAPRSARAGGYDPQLEWLILCGDAAMGASGTLAGVVSQIERGSVGGTGNLDAAGSYKHPYTDLQIGGGASGIGEVELHRHLSAALSLVRPATRERLRRRYSAPRAAYRADAGFGARDRYVEGSDGRAGQHNLTRTGTEDLLKEYAGLAFELCDNPGQLLIACIEPSPVKNKKINKSEQARRAKIVREALARAHAADTEDHAEWFAAKARVPGLRSQKDRTGREHGQVTAGALGVRKTPAERGPRRLLRTEAECWDKVGQTILAGAAAQAAE